MVPLTVQVSVRTPKAAGESCVFPWICFSQPGRLMNHSWLPLHGGFSTLNPISFTPEAINQVTDAYLQLNNETWFISPNCLLFVCNCVFFPDEAKLFTAPHITHLLLQTKKFSFSVLALCCNFSHPWTLCSLDPVKKHLCYPAVLFSPELDCCF